MKNYEITVSFDHADSIFVAEVPDLPGCAAHCKTQIEAIQNVNEAIELWLETPENSAMKFRSLDSTW